MAGAEKDNGDSVADSLAEDQGDAMTPDEASMPPVSHVRPTHAEPMDSIRRSIQAQPVLKEALEQLAQLGLNLEPLFQRLSNKPDRPADEIFRHTIECVRTALRAVRNLQQGVPSIYAHKDHGLSRSAVDFARSHETETMQAGTRLERIEIALRLARSIATADASLEKNR